MAPPGKTEYQRFGNYVLLDRISVGGMAEVFRARQTGVEGFARTVAIKRILPTIAEDEDFIEMFVDEAKLAVHMAHANIVQVYDLGNAKDQYYIAMEYVAGLDLRTVWDRARRRNRLLPIAMSCYVMQKVCEGLDFAHRKKDDVGEDIGLVHRDVSPQNVLVSFEGEVKVVDFGIAKASQQVSKTQAGILKGKFGYMSPEQVRGRDLDNRSDIFACGILLWELLVGDRLFLGETDFSTLEKVRNVDLVPPTHFNKTLSPQVERIVMKALSKDRDDRYRYASEMAEDLQRFLFESNQPFARTDLQRYMKQHFEKEIGEEYGRLERYRGLDLAQYDEPAVLPLTMDALSPLTEQPTGETQAAAIGRAETATMGDMSTAVQTQAAGGGWMSSPPSGYAGPDLDAAAAMHPAPVAPKGVGALPGWVKATIAGLSVLVLAAVGLVSFVMMGGLKASPGSISVDVSPNDAQIFLNNELVATRSPFTKQDLEAGNYVLKIERDGYESEVKSLRVEPGQIATESFILQAEKGDSSIVVRTTPAGLDVWVDGEPSGQQTPANITQLKPGEYPVTLKKDGARVYEATVKLGKGDVQTLEVDLGRLPPILEVNANVLGARVTVNGRDLGETPIEIKTLSPGSAKVVLRKKGCKKYSESVNLEAGVRAKVEARLNCK